MFYWRAKIVIIAFRLLEAKDDGKDTQTKLRGSAGVYLYINVIATIQSTITLAA